MSGAAAAALCAGAGVALAAFGVHLIKSNEVKEGESAFASALGSRSLGTAGGWGALFFGLFLAALVAPMLYLRG